VLAGVRACEPTQALVHLGGGLAGRGIAVRWPAQVFNRSAKLARSRWVFSSIVYLGELLDAHIFTKPARLKLPRTSTSLRGKGAENRTSVDRDGDLCV